MPQGGTGVSSALITQLAADQDPIDLLARMRGNSHAGQALGAAVGAVVIAMDARAGYSVAIILNARSVLLFAVELGRVPSISARPVELVRPRARRSARHPVHNARHDLWRAVPVFGPDVHRPTALDR